jgi:hypothetical protein
MIMSHPLYPLYPCSLSLQSTTAASTNLGVTGLAVTGGAFYNHLSNPDGSLALANEGTTLDSCLGHSDQVSGGFFFNVQII